MNNIIDISAGKRYYLALNFNGEIYVAGKNEAGQLGIGDKNDRDVPTIIKNFSIYS